MKAKDMASERRENLRFRPPHFNLTHPLQRTPANIRIKLTLLETRIPGLHFLPLIVWVYVHLCIIQK